MHENWKEKKKKLAYKVVSNTHRVMPWLQGQIQDFKLAGVEYKEKKN